MNEEADALERAAAVCGFASSAELARAAVDEFLAVPPEHGPEDSESDIIEYEVGKARGEPTPTADEVRARLRDPAAGRRRAW